MSNLLEKASILLTPTAYDDGRILSVKPEEVLGEEKIVNGTFDENVNGWITNNANASFVWQINKTALFTSTSFAYVRVSPTLNLNAAVYKVSFDILSFEGTLSNVHIGLGTSGNTITTTGSYTYFYTSTGGSTEFQIRPNSGGTGSITIDNVSVKEDISGDFDFTRNSSATRVNSQGLIEDMQILSGDLVSNGDFSQEGSELITNGDFATDTAWVKGIGWSISGGTANCDGTQTSQSNFFQVGVVPINTFYKVTFTATISAGGVILAIGGSNAQPTVTASGTYTFTSRANSGDANLYLSGNADFIGSIDNVSAKEVGQDWTILSPWIVGNNVLSIDGSQVSNQYTSQVIPSLTSGNKYKLQYTVSNITAGQFRINVANTLGTYVSSNGTYEFVFNATSGTTLQLQASTTLAASITNISVIEITDDTNLPRINYEGFSYQDSLGSEEVVNGDFATDSNWIKNGQVTIGGGVAYFDSDGTFTQIAQSISGVSGKNVKVVIEITEYTQGTLKVLFSGGTQQNLPNSVGVHTLYFNNADSDTINIARLGGVTNLKIDNVSVKEYLGQEVVPDSGCGSWLFEPQSTNLIITSDSGVYGNNPASEILTTAPDGTNTAVRPVPDSNSDRYTGQISGGTYATDTKITYSWYRKRISTPVIDIYVGDLQPNVLVNVTQVGSTIQIKSNINGFDRFSATFNITDGSLASNIRLYFGAIIGTGNSSVAYWGHQLEVGSFATSIIPTNGSTVTRLQDAAFGSGSSDLINSTEGVLYFEGSALADDGTNRYMSLGDGTTSNYIYFRYVSTSNNVLFRTVIANVTVNTLTVVLSDTTQNHKFAYKWKSGDYALWVDGVEISTDSSATTFPSNTLNNLGFNFPTSTGGFYAKTKCVAVFKEALTDDELECLTSDETSFSSFNALALANNYTII